MNAAQLRFMLYLIAALTGAVVTVIGAVNGDTALIATGLGLVTVGGVAAPNTPVKSPPGDHAAS